MPDYQVKNVEPVAVGADVQVRVFTLTDGEEIPHSSKAPKSKPKTM